MTRFALNRAGITSRWIECEGARLHVYDGPGGGSLPPVVIIHGLAAAGAAFARVATRVRPHVERVVLPELPGHGFSARPTGRRVTPELVLDCIEGALDRVLDRPALVYGSSLGGAVALEYAIRRPERVKGLMLVSPAGARLTETDFRALVGSFDVTGKDDARRLLERLYHRPPWFLGLIAHEFPDLLRTPAVREILESATPDNAADPAALASLSMPILLLWGRSERLLPPAGLAFYRAHLPAHAVIEEPHGFGHSPQLDAPDRVAARVLAFAREVAQAPASAPAA